MTTEISKWLCVWTVCAGIVLVPTFDCEAVESDRDRLSQMQLELMTEYPIQAHPRLNRVLFSQMSDLLFPGNTNLLVQAPVRATFVINENPKFVNAVMEPFGRISSQPYKIYQLEELKRSGDPVGTLYREITDLMANKGNQDRLHVAIQLSNPAGPQFLADLFSRFSKESVIFHSQHLAFTFFAQPSPSSTPLQNRMRTDELAPVLESFGYSSEVTKYMANIVYVDSTCIEKLTRQ